MTVGKRIKLIREEQGLTQEELAKKMGYSWKSSVSEAEKCGDNITTTKVKKFADALGVSFKYLMGYEDRNGNPIPTNPEEEEKTKRIRDLYATIPPEVLEDAETDSQLKEVISLFLNGDETDRETYLRILRGLQQNP